MDLLSGISWDCIGKLESPHGGFIYKFKFNKEGYDRFISSEYIEPNLEPSPGCLKEDKEKINKLKFLGYDFDGNILFLPNREAILRAWNYYFKDKFLKISETIDTANHTEFIRAYKDNDAILSTSKLFVHDQYYHLMNTLTIIIDEYEEYTQAKEKISLYLESVLKILNSLETCIEKRTLEICFASYVDAWSSLNDLKRLKHESEQLYKNDYKQNIYLCYIKGIAMRELGPEIFKPEFMDKISKYYEKHFNPIINLS